MYEQGDNEHADRHWEKEKVLERYLDQYYIVNAWIVFSRDLSWRLSNFLDRDALENMRYGIVTGASNQAIILMQIGDTIVTPNGHIVEELGLTSDLDVAPKLGAEYFDHTSLRAPTKNSNVDSFTHDRNGNWRSKMDERIKNRENINLIERI